MRGLAGIVSGSPAFVDDVASLGRKMELPPRLACALVGLTTGTIEYAAAGMDIIEMKLGFPPGVGSAIASVLAGDRAEPGIVATRTLARALGVTCDDIRLVVGCARQGRSRSKVSSSLRRLAPETAIVLEELALGSMKAVDNFLERYSHLFGNGQSELKANVRCAIVLSSTRSLASFGEAFGALMRKFVSHDSRSTGDSAFATIRTSCFTTEGLTCIVDIARRVGEAPKNVIAALLLLLHSLNVDSKARPKPAQDPDQEALELLEGRAVTEGAFKLEKFVSKLSASAESGGIRTELVSIMRLAAGRPLSRTDCSELPWLFRADGAAEGSDAEIRCYALIWVCSSSIGDSVPLSVPSSSSSVSKGHHPAHESFMSVWETSGCMPGEFCVMLLHEVVSGGEIGSPAMLEALWTLVLLHKPHCDRVWRMRPLLTSLNNPSVGTIACLKCLHALSHATPKSRSRLDSLHADFAALAHNIGVDANTLLIFVMSGLGDGESVDKLARILHQPSATIRIFMLAALDSADAATAYVHPAFATDRMHVSPEKELRQAFLETARGRGHALLKLGSWLYQDAAASFDKLPSSQTLIGCDIGPLHELVLGPTCTGGSYSDNFLEAGVHYICVSFGLVAVEPLLRGMLQLSCGDTRGIEAASDIALLPTIYMHHYILEDLWYNWGRGSGEGAWTQWDDNDPNIGINTPIQMKDLRCTRNMTQKEPTAAAAAEHRIISFVCNTCLNFEAETAGTGTQITKAKGLCISCARCCHVGHALEPKYSGDADYRSVCNCACDPAAAAAPQSAASTTRNPQFCVVQLIVRVAAARAGCATLEPTSAAPRSPGGGGAPLPLTEQIVQGLVHLVLGHPSAPDGDAKADADRRAWEEAAEIVAALPILVRQEDMGQHVMRLVECLERRVPGGSGGLLAAAAQNTLRRLQRPEWRWPAARGRDGSDSGLGERRSHAVTSVEPTTCFRNLEERVGTIGICAAYSNVLCGCASAEDVSAVFRDESAAKILASIAFLAQTVTRWTAGPGGTHVGLHPLQSLKTRARALLALCSDESVDRHCAALCVIANDLCTRDGTEENRSRLMKCFRGALRCLVGDYAQGIDHFVETTNFKSDESDTTAEWLRPWVDLVLQHERDEARTGLGTSAADEAAAAQRLCDVVKTIILRSLPPASDDDNLAMQNRVIAVATTARAATTGSAEVAAELEAAVNNLLGTKRSAVSDVVLGALALARGDFGKFGVLAQKLGEYNPEKIAAFAKNLLASRDAAAKQVDKSSVRGEVARGQILSVPPVPSSERTAAATVPGSAYSALFAACDSNSNGRLSFSEFKVCLNFPRTH